MKKRVSFHLSLRTRNVSNRSLRDIICPVKTIYRMGSTTPTEEITHRRTFIEINTADACRISSNKILMKERFCHGKVRTPSFYMMKDNSLDGLRARTAHRLAKWPAGIIAKRYNSSKGNGLALIKTMDDFNNFISGKSNSELSKWIFERYSTYSREYRLHITKDGCFYACRKMLRNDATVRWHRHDENSVWITEENELFDKPANWDAIVNDCVSALKAVGLDIAAFDIKVQRVNGAEPKWLILECNSAPGLGEVGIEKYRQQINVLINKKLDEQRVPQAHSGH